MWRPPAQPIIGYGDPIQMRPFEAATDSKSNNGFYMPRGRSNSHCRTFTFVVLTALLSTGRVNLGLKKGKSHAAGICCCCHRAPGEPGRL